jgi:thiol-disulfide isomerase/thioredoxin
MKMSKVKLMEFLSKTNPRFINRLFFGALFTSLLVFSFSAQAEPAEFILPDMKDKQHKLSDYRGKWVVVNYWATWCPPCLTEIPELVDFHEDHKDKDAVVLGINFEDIGLEGLKRFSEEYFMNYPVLRTKPGASSALGVIPGLPTTYLVSPEGEIIARQVGPVTAKLIAEFIDQQTAE